MLFHSSIVQSFRGGKRIERTRRSNGSGKEDVPVLRPCRMSALMRSPEITKNTSTPTQPLRTNRALARDDTEHGNCPFEGAGGREACAPSLV